MKKISWALDRFPKIRHFKSLSQHLEALCPDLPFRSKKACLTPNLCFCGNTETWRIKKLFLMLLLVRNQVFWGKTFVVVPEWVTIRATSSWISRSSDKMDKLFRLVKEMRKTLPRFLADNLCLLSKHVIFISPPPHTSDQSSSVSCRWRFWSCSIFFLLLSSWHQASDSFFYLGQALPSNVTSDEVSFEGWILQIPTQWKCILVPAY